MTTQQQDRNDSALKELARQSHSGIIQNLWSFLSENKKWWLLPILICFLLFGLLIFLAATGAASAPIERLKQSLITRVPTTYLESQTMRVLQNGAVLDQSTTVFAGVCSDIYLYLDFSNVGGPAIAGMDLSTVDSQATSYYFVSNSKDPTGAYGAYGSTGYNLFRSDVVTMQDTYIGTATSLTVTAVPVPGALALLAAAGIGVGGGRRRRG